MTFRTFVIGLALFGAGTLSATPASAQADDGVKFHYFKRAVPLEVQTESLYIVESQAAPAAGQPAPFGPGLGLDRAAVARRLGAQNVDPWVIRGWSRAQFAPGARTRAQVIDAVADAAQNPGVGFVSPVFKDPDGVQRIATPELLVGFDAGVTPAQARAIIAQSNAGEILEENFAGMPGAYRLRANTRSALRALDIANDLAMRDGVEYAEPSFLDMVTLDLFPNDPFFLNGSLWGLHNTGQSGGVADMDMNGPEAWDISAGDPGVIVLVMDSGADQTHPDLNQVPGNDFTSEAPGNGGPGNSMDNHGTAVCGTISAIFNNGIGVSGIAPDCRVASARVFITTGGVSGISSPAWLANALSWGQGIGARVSNASLSIGSSAALNNMYAATRANGMVHFAAAGNDGSFGTGYPASLSTVNAISAITRTGSLASFSNFGPAIAYAAPGVSVWTTDRAGPDGYSNSDYTSIDGTSFASPYAAGVAALVLSVYPELNADFVEMLLAQTAKDLGAPGRDDNYGHGLLDAGAALAGGDDCNDNGELDFADIAGGFSLDENGNSIPDECDCLAENRGEVMIELVGASTTSETGGDTQLQVSLSSTLAPGADVFVMIESLDTTEGVVDTPILIFTNADWTTPQFVTVTGLNDGAVDGDVAYDVRAVADSDDLCWTFTADTVSVVNLDNDRSITETDKVVADDAQADDQFGAAVALDGDILAVGAFGDDDFANQSGAGYIYRRTGSAWTQEAKVVSSAPLTGSRFGLATDVDAGRVVFGAPRDSASAFLAGAAYIFTFDGEDWVQAAQILSSDAQSADSFGVAVAIQGDVMVVGADSEDQAGSNAGAAYVFRFDGAAWNEEIKLIGNDSDTGDAFGNAVDIDGDTILVGAPGRQNGGKVYAYRFDGGSWTLEDSFAGSDTVANDAFGDSVSLQGDTAAVGAPLGGDGGSESGAVYLFNRSGASWTQSDRLITTDSPTTNRLGASVALRGDVLIAGANTDEEAADGTGSATLFLFDGAQWTEQVKLLSSDIDFDDELGTDVALFDGLAVLGSPLDDDAGLQSGSAYTYGSLTDCDGNGVIDALDIIDGAADADGNGVLDVCEAAPCTADLSGDGNVNGADLAVLLGAWGPCPGCPADFNGDDAVNGADLAFLLGAWGPCP